MTRWPAPAKVNLFLHITGQRSDGYHELQTLFQFLDYGDTLSFRLRPETALTLKPSIAGIAQQENLILRAAKTLQQFTGTTQGIDIILDKRLPIGGGLGGGSSNAATTLVALNQLWECHLPLEQLMQIGLSLGADVPIFISGCASWAEGVGEKLTPVNPPEPWYSVITPNCSVSTEKAFSAPELTRDCKSITISDFLSGRGENIFEPLVRQHYPVVAQAMDWLGQFGDARLSGTGASIFARFDTRHQAQQVLEQLPDHWQGFVAKGCNQSPLLAVAQQKNPSPTE